MDTDRNLLFGVLAFQKGAIDADRLAETCAAIAGEATVSVADRLVDRGLLTVDQKVELERHAGRRADGTRRRSRGHARRGAGRPLPGGAAQGKAARSRGRRQADGRAPAGGPRPDRLAGRGGGESSRTRYTLSHLYAKGGMGQVWLAHDPELGREIALKELRPDQAENSEVCSRFLAEARVTAQLEHPGIVPVYELGEGDAPYYTMRFIKGGTLSQATRAYHKDRVAGTADPLGLVKLLGAFIGVCHAVGYAHSRGVIHRDLKGQNVVLGDFGEVIVLDWGLAKRIGTGADAGRAGPDAPMAGGVSMNGASANGVTGRRRRRDAPAGTRAAARLGVAAADRIRGRPRGDHGGPVAGHAGLHGPRAGRGAAARHRLADRRLRAGGDPLRDPHRPAPLPRQDHQGAPPEGPEGDPLPPRQVNPQVAPALQAVCLKALSKAPGDRYASATELAQEVQRYLADEPVLAYPEPWTRRAARWARKHRTAVAAAAGLLVAATAALSVSTVLIARERNEARTQGEQARTAVDDMYTKVAENWLEDRLDPLQKEFLEKTLNYYEKFTGFAATTPAVRLEHGRAYQRMGEIHRKLGRFDEAERAFRKALGAARAPRRRGGLRPRRPPRPGRDPDPAGRPPVPQRPARPGGGPLRPGGRGPGADGRRGRRDRRRIAGCWPGPSAARPSCSAARATSSPPGPSPCVPPTSWSRSSRPIPSPPRSATTSPRRTTSWAGSRATWARRTPTSSAFRRAYELLDPLVAGFPTVPRYREAMAQRLQRAGQPRARDRPAGRVRGPLAARCSPRPSGWPRISPTAPSTGGSWPAATPTWGASSPSRTASPRPSRSSGGASS